MIKHQNVNAIECEMLKLNANMLKFNVSTTLMKKAQTVMDNIININRNARGHTQNS